MMAKAWSANSDHATSITRSSLAPPASHRPYRSGVRTYSGNSTRLYCRTDPTQPSHATPCARPNALWDPRPWCQNARGLRARQSRAIWHMVCHFASVGSPQAGSQNSLAIRRKPRQAREMNDTSKGGGASQVRRRSIHPGSGRRKAAPFPRGRVLRQEEAAAVKALLGQGPRERALLIEYLHLIQDREGCLWEGHLQALAEELRMPMAQVYEVATCYAHFDVVGAGEE